jgi:hypothetical protein
MKRIYVCLLPFILWRELHLNHELSQILWGLVLMAFLRLNHQTLFFGVSDMVQPNYKQVIVNRLSKIVAFHNVRGT